VFGMGTGVTPLL